MQNSKEEITRKMEIIQTDLESVIGAWDAYSTNVTPPWVKPDNTKIRRLEQVSVKAFVLVYGNVEYAEI